MTVIIYINNFEIILLLLSLVTLFIVTLKIVKSVKKSVILTLLLIPALYLSVEGTTQFLTNDSSYGIYEIITIENSSLRHWHEGSYKTSIATVGTLLNLLKKYTYMDNTDLKMFAKAIHWLICILTLIAMYYFVDKYYIPTQQKSIYFLIYFYSLLLQPSNLFAFKIINYDPFSLILGGFAVVLALVALKTQQAKFAVASIVFATLATQEKVIAAPVLLFTMFVFTYIKAQSCFNKFSLKNCLFSLPASFYAIMIVFLTQIMTFLVVFILVKPDSINSISAITFSSLMMPVAACLNYLKISGSYWHKFVVLIILLPSISISLILINQKINFVHLKGQLGVISAASLLAVIAAFYIGIITPYFVSLVLLPTSIPYTGDDYLSPRIFNGFQKYFIGVKTYYGYAIANIGYAYRTFIMYIPSVYLLLIPFLFYYGYNKNNRQLLEWEIVLLAALAMPIFYAISDVPLSGGGRYFNLYLLLMVLPLGIKLTYSIEEYRPIGKWLITAVFLMAILIEVSPFRPFFAHFNHIWRNNFTWGGWGEEYFLVGKQIEHLVATEKIAGTEQIVLHGTYSGVWLNKHFAGQIKYRKMGCRFSKLDYYIITSQVTVDRLYDIKPYFKDMTFLKNIKPVFTVSQWGRVYIWVYRGDQIKHKADLANCKKLQKK
jgi:hypothetical protein